jgi:8-oxo-dGTP pyrophosphatase MutT (NUDIX family)
MKADTHITEKISVGIGCVRRTNAGMEILLVKKRYTYAYNKFVTGRYRSENRAEMIAMFDSMTAEEKLDILSLDFRQIWYRIWLSHTQKMSSFYAAKSKFENTFIADGGDKLRALMARSKKNGSLIWEIPKGRKKTKMENDISCGLREFSEETGVTKRQIKIFGDNAKYSYVSDGIRYTFIYYFALAKTNFEPVCSVVNKTQIGEIVDIKWMNMLALMQVDKEGRLIPFVKKIFKCMKKRIA